MAPRFPGFRFVPYGMPNPFPSPPVQSDSGGEQPPRPPSPLSGLLGLILKYEQWRQSILRDENKNLSTPDDPQGGQPENKPNHGFSSGPHDPDARLLMRIPPDGDAASPPVLGDRERLPNVAAPSLAPYGKSRRRSAASRATSTGAGGSGGSNSRGNDGGDFCTERRGEETSRCWQTWQERRDSGQVGYPWDDFLQGCKDRAWERYFACNKNWRRPALDEPNEWNEQDEENWFNDQR